MRLKLLVLPVLAVSMLTVSARAFSQAVPAYQREKTWPILLGVGPSGYNLDEGHGLMYGGTMWIDMYPGFLPRVLQGLGGEAEARDISLDRSPLRPNARQDTVEGGPIYAWRHYHDIHPYAKYLIGHGSIDFAGSPTYSHDTRSFWGAGGGIEYRFYRQFWARADYEHQTWQPLFGSNFHFKPQGLTLGVAFDFAHPLPR